MNENILVSVITIDHLIMSKVVQISGNSITLDKFPNECPFCHNKITPQAIGTNTFRYNSKHSARVVFICPDENCGEVFISYYNYNNISHGANSQIYLFIKNSIGVQLKKEFHQSIKETSQNFIEIYNQAYQAEQYGLEDICGVGYRKALEFLIKDFCIKHNPEKTEDIKKELLGKVIDRFVDDKKIKDVSKRAVWLGNDETHYIRKWEKKDLNDLKIIIDLTLTFIQSKYDYDELMVSMPEQIK